MVKMIMQIESRASDGTVVEFNSYCGNGIQITIKNGSDEMSALVVIDDLFEAVNRCADERKRKREESEERQRKTEENREKRRRKKEEEKSEKSEG